jgi:membrane-bound lytic murein transglycosylase D
MELADKQALVGKATVATAPQPLATTNGPGEIDGDYIIYTVRKGDSIWDIVKMFDNVTTTQVLSLNNITDPAKIKVGQRLKIKKKS